MIFSLNSDLNSVFVQFNSLAQNSEEWYQCAPKRELIGKIYFDNPPQRASFSIMLEDNRLFLARIARDYIRGEFISENDKVVMKARCARPMITHIRNLLYAVALVFTFLYFNADVGIVAGPMLVFVISDEIYNFFHRENLKKIVIKLYELLSDADTGDG